MQRDEISEDTINNVISEFADRLREKIKKKGNGAFVSIWEGFGKLTEEYGEVADAVHRKHKRDYCDENYDVAITALYSIMSIKSEKKMEG